MNAASSGPLPEDSLSRGATLKDRAFNSLKSQIDQLGEQTEGTYQDKADMKQKVNALGRHMLNVAFKQVDGAIAQGAQGLCCCLCL